MSSTAQEFAALRALHEAAVLLKEGGLQVALLPSFPFAANSCPETMGLLLVPFSHSDYNTRLFSERKINNRGSNWNGHRVVDRNWWSPSWHHISAEMHLPAILYAHLKAVA